MRTLLLFRHAKSSWDDVDLSDHERPLTKRGARDATRMGEQMRADGISPDLFVCSGAVRTRASLTLVLAALGPGKRQVLHDDALYLAEPSQLRRILAGIGPRTTCVMLIGHNPGLHQFALELTGSGETRDMAELAQKFPTAALAVIDFDAATWTTITAGSGRLRTFATPKRLPQTD